MRFLKSLFLVAFLFVAGTVYTRAAIDWRYGLLASYDNVDAIFRVNGSSTDIGTTNCFSVGPIVSCDIIDYFSIQSGLYFSMYKFTTGEAGQYLYNLSSAYVLSKEETTLFNLTLPIYGVARLPVREVELLLEAGPQFTCGLAGKIDNTYAVAVGSNSYEYSEVNNPYDYLKRFNCAIHLGVGAEYMGARIMVGYNIGVFNVSKVENRDVYIGGFTISASYLF